MAQKCRACSHPDLKKINSRIIEGEGKARIGAAYGISEGAIRKHAENHLPAALARRAEAQADRRGESLAEEIRRKKAEAEEIQAAATRDGDPRTALMAVKVYADLVKLLLDAAALAASGPDEVEVVLQVGAE